MKRSLVLTGALVTAAIAGDTSVRIAAQPRAKKPRAAAAQMVPQFQYDKTFPKPLPNQWKLGHVAGVTVDARDHVWIIQRPTSLKNSEMEATDLSVYGAVGANPGSAASSANGGVANVGGAGRGPLALCCRPAPPVIEFDHQGNVIQAWGGASRMNEYEWPTPAPKSPDASLGTGNFGERGIYVDSKDNVWIGADGPGDAQALKFTRFGRLLFQIGKHGKSGGSNDIDNLNGAAGFVVDTKNNELFVADGLRNRRVIVFDAYSGKYKRHWGAYGKKPDDSVAMKQYQPDVKHPQFGDVHGITLSRDGLLYVCDRVNNRVQVFKTDGTFVTEGAVAPKTLGGSAYDIALSADPGQRFAYVVDGMNQKVWILDRRSLETVGSFGHGGHAGGAFDAANVIATDSNGNIYVGETWESKRVQRFLYKGLGAATP
jgi:DNA-binding beta-propeller fold protein YncE